MLARLAPTLSKLGRFNAPSFQICPPRGPSTTNGRPSAETDADSERASGGTRSFATDAHFTAMSISNSSSTGRSHRRFCSAPTILRSDSCRSLYHACVLVWWQSSIGRAATCSTKEASFGKNKHHPSKPQPQSVISLMTQRHAAHQASFSPAARMLFSISC